MHAAAVSLACLVCGVVLAALSMRDARRATSFERWSGVCIVLGLCLLGTALQLAR